MPMRPLLARRHLTSRRLRHALFTTMQNDAGLADVLAKALNSSEDLATVTAVWHAIVHVLAPFGLFVRWGFRRNTVHAAHMPTNLSHTVEVQTAVFASYCMSAVYLPKTSGAVCWLLRTAG